MEDRILQAQRQTFSYIGIAMFVMTIIAGVLLFAGAGIAEYFWPGSLENTWIKFAVVLLPQYLVAMPVAALMLRQTPRITADKQTLGAGVLAVILVICLAVMYVGSIVGNIVTSIIETVVNGEMTDFLDELLTGADILATVAASVVLAPIAEELFYRKLVIDRMGVYGERAAVIVSALIFGLAHGNLDQFFYAFGLGLVLGYVYLKTRRIIYTIGLHMIINLIGGVLLPLAYSHASDTAVGVLGLGVFGIMAAGLALLIQNRQRITLWPPRGAQPWVSPALLNIGMIMFFVISAVMFVWNTVAAFM